MSDRDEDNDEPSEEIVENWECLVDSYFKNRLCSTGIRYIKTLERRASEYDELIPFRREMTIFFQNISSYVTHHNESRFLNELSIVSLGRFGLPLDRDAVCLSTMMQIVYDIEMGVRSDQSPSVDDYGNEEFEDETSDLFEQYPSDHSNSHMSSIASSIHSNSRTFQQPTSGDRGRELEVHDWGESYNGPGEYLASPASEPVRGARSMNDRGEAKYSDNGFADAKGARDRDSKSAGGAYGGAAAAASEVPSVRASTASRKRNPQWITDKKWTLSDNIGEGAFGKVYKCLDNMGRFYAVKIQEISGRRPEDMMTLANEIHLMRDLNHPNIVLYIGCKIDEEEKLCYIFQQYCSGGSIAHVLEAMQKCKPPIFGFNDHIIRHYTIQILSGLCYLHENKIIHRDIKGGNILLDTNGVAKLADFGCSTSMSHLGETIMTKQMIGSPYFMAPEVFSQSNYGRRGDVWAVGCTVIQMITGQPPWKERHLQLFQLANLVQNWTEGPPPIAKEISRPLRELLEMCFVKDYKARPFPAEIMKCQFLTDEMEDSMELSHDSDRGEDKLEDSISIEEQLHRAHSRQALHPARSSGMDFDDSFSNYINKNLPPRSVVAAPAQESNKPMDPPRKPNPFARGQNSISSVAASVSPPAGAFPRVHGAGTPHSPVEGEFKAEAKAGDGGFGRAHGHGHGHGPGGGGVSAATLARASRYSAAPPGETSPHTPSYSNTNTNMTGGGPTGGNPFARRSITQLSPQPIVEEGSEEDSGPSPRSRPNSGTHDRPPIRPATNARPLFSSPDQGQGQGQGQGMSLGRGLGSREGSREGPGGNRSRSGSETDNEITGSGPTSSSLPNITPNNARGYRQPSPREAIEAEFAHSDMDSTSVAPAPEPRIVSPRSAAVPQSSLSRPNSSKSLQPSRLSQQQSLRSSQSAAASSASSALAESKSASPRGSGSRPTSASKADPDSDEAAEEDDGKPKKWKCLNQRCGAMNEPDDPFCMGCAFRKGVTGNRSLNQAVFMANYNASH